MWLSAQANVGIDLLFSALSERLDKQVVSYHLNIPPQAGKLRGTLYKLNCIIEEYFDEQGYCHVDIKLPLREWNRLIKQELTQIEEYIEQ